MSTVTKPVMLNETGQQIKGTLEEIRDAITGSGSTHYPVSIRISTPPEKVDYIVGEQLDLTGIAVQAIYDNGVPYDVTGDTTFSPSDGTVLSASDTAITATWTWTLGQQTQTFTATRAINVSTVQSISITTPPTKTEYMEGETLDLTGIVVKAIMSNQTQIDVTAQCSFSPANGATLVDTDTTVTVTLTTSGSTFTATQAITVSPIVYGVEWDGSSSPVWTRTDAAASFVDPVPYYSGMSGSCSSPFDTISPWKDLVTEERTGGTMVKIPRFWYKLSQTSTGLKVQISPKAVNGFHVSPAHMSRGSGDTEKAYVYVGRYNCKRGDYHSVTNSNVAINAARSDARTAIHNLDTNIWQSDFAMRFTIWLLYLVEYANWNSQETIGKGCGNGGMVNSGYTDNMPYHTGTTQSNRTTYGQGIQYRHIEGLFDNGQEYIDGCYSDQTKLYLIIYPSSFSDSSYGTPVFTLFTGNKYPKTFSINNDVFPIFVPTESGGSATTYMCDNWDFNTSSARPVIVGGGDIYPNYDNYGLFNFGDRAASNQMSSVTTRIMELPTT